MIISKDLYAKISRVMPIPCIDLLVTDREDRVLLLKRSNDPMKGEWWFPGGRVVFMETRIQAAERKLREECNLQAQEIKDLGTYDLMINYPDSRLGSHSITTLFYVRVGQIDSLKLDNQHSDALWQSTDEWKTSNLHQFVRLGLERFIEDRKRSNTSDLRE